MIDLWRLNATKFTIQGYDNEIMIYAMCINKNARNSV